MTIDQLLMIKQCADCMRVDRSKLGAAVMYNLEYDSVNPHHAHILRTLLSYLVKKHYAVEIEDIKSSEDYWKYIPTRKPVSRVELLKAMGIAARELEGDRIEEGKSSDIAPMAVENNKRGTFVDFFTKAFNQVRELF